MIIAGIMLALGGLTVADMVAVYLAGEHIERNAYFFEEEVIRIDADRVAVSEDTSDDCNRRRVLLVYPNETCFRSSTQSSDRFHRATIIYITGQLSILFFRTQGTHRKDTLE